jgi:hypothetical protein
MRKIYVIDFLYERETARGAVTIKATCTHYSSSPAVESLKNHFIQQKSHELGVNPQRFKVQELGVYSLSPEEYFRSKGYEIQSQEALNKLILETFYF